MANNRSTRTAPPAATEGGANDLPLDHALSLLLADETENALRWGAAVLESGPWTPSALVVTARLLDQMGRKRAAIEGLNLAVRQATDEGNLPLAMAALGDLRTLGADVTEALDRVAGAFCEGSERIRDAQTAPLLPQFGEFRPLSPFLTGPALASKAAQIVESVRRTEVDEGDDGPERFAPLPLFSALGKESLHDLLAAFETLTVPAGHAVIREGEEEAAAYIVARGELEVSRRSSDESGKPVVLARLGSGAFFGEMALLSQLPGAASVIATRPSILLVAKREALEAVVERHPDVAVELAAHCRRQSVANLGWASPVVVAIPARERAVLVERFETRMFEAGDKLVEAGESARGLHLVVSGEIAVVASEGGERVVLATLTAGETVGEVELVLCRNAAADAVAVRPTATLFLEREEFFALVQDHPAILHGLYGIAVRRHAETSLALEAGSSAVGEESLLGDVPGEFAALVENPAPLASAVAPNPARITPLARGTLGLPRASSPPPAPATPTSTPPSVRPGARSTLPPPPMRTPSAPPPSPRVTRGTLPPPVPPSARFNDTLPGPALQRPSSFAPVTATGRASIPSQVPARSSRAAGVIGFLGVAAAFIVFFSIKGFHTDSSSEPTATPANAPIALPATTRGPIPADTVASAPAVETQLPPVATAAAAAPPIATPAPRAAMAPKNRPAQSTTAAATRTVVVTVEPSAAPVVATPPASATPAFPVAKPTVTSQAVSAGEFGGRE
jgi:cAMP-dependent protein kinase regulator